MKSRRNGINLKEQKKYGILLLVIGAVLCVVGYLLGDAYLSSFYNGLGCAIFACGAVRLVRCRRLGKDPERAADYEAMLNDERTVYIANKARSWTFFICLYAQLAAGLLAILVFRQPLIGQTLCIVTSAQALLHAGLFWYFNRKY